MNIFDVQRIIKWTMAFQRNLIFPDCELTGPELGKAAAACQHGRDPWESAAEIRTGDPRKVA